MQRRQKKFDEFVPGIFIHVPINHTPQPATVWNQLLRAERIERIRSGVEEVEWLHPERRIQSRAMGISTSQGTLSGARMVMFIHNSVADAATSPQ